MMNDLYMLEINKLVFNINKRLKISHEKYDFHVALSPWSYK
jgi:hypothetical protein